MRITLLTWNPARYDISPDTHRRYVDTTRAGGVVPLSWGTGQNRSRISRGEAALLLRQGSAGRGLVAAGTVASEIQSAPRDDDPRRIGWFVDVDWHTFLPLADLLPTEELLQRLPEVPWNFVFGSGFTVPAAAAEKLLALWREHLRSLS